MANGIAKPQVRALSRSVGLWIAVGLCVFVILLCLLIASCNSSSSAEPAKPKPAAPVEKPMEPPEKSVMIVKKVQLDPVQWSEWISVVQLKPLEIPDDARFQFQVNTPDWCEFLSWNSKEPILKPKGSKTWLGKISESTFQLRGEREAIVRIQYFFR